MEGSFSSTPITQLHTGCWNFTTLKARLPGGLNQQYDFTIEHRPGCRHYNADALLRWPCWGDACKKLWQIGVTGRAQDVSRRNSNTNSNTATCCMAFRGSEGYRLSITLTTPFAQPMLETCRPSDTFPHVSLAPAFVTALLCYASLHNAGYSVSQPHLDIVFSATFGRNWWSCRWPIQTWQGSFCPILQVVA